MRQEGGGPDHSRNRGSLGLLSSYHIRRRRWEGGKEREATPISRPSSPSPSRKGWTGQGRSHPSEGPDRKNPRHKSKWSQRRFYSLGEVPPAVRGKPTNRGDQIHRMMGRDTDRTLRTKKKKKKKLCHQSETTWPTSHDRVSIE